MTEDQFKADALRAETLARTSEEIGESRYWMGYLRGLRRRFHGEGFGTEDEHAQWLAATRSGDEMRRREAEGYRDGWGGDDKPTTKPDLIRAVRAARGWSQTDLADRLQVDKSTVFRWEKGSIEPTPQAWLLLCMMYADPLLDPGAVADPTA